MPTKAKPTKKIEKIEIDKIPKITEAKALEAIKGTAGIISTIAKRLDVSWGTAEIYIQKWDSTKRAFQDEREGILDMAEATILTAIKSGDTGSAKWILSTIGRKRGFTDRQEISISGDLGTPVEFVFVDPPQKHADTE
jgi:hypothetical protein